jgi:hypothetical protein
VLRQELLSLVASRLDLPDGLVADLLAGVATVPAPTAPARPVSNGVPRAVSPHDRIERTFLALCIALPTPGHEALDRVTTEHFSTPLLQRAADHLRVHLAAPTDAVPDDDPDLEALMRELVVRAGRGEPKKALLVVEELQLDLARVDRAIAAARASGEGGVSALVGERNAVKERLDAAMGDAVDD